MPVLFVKRTEAPTTDNRYYYADNPFHASGYGLPNCTCYAWGRFYELTGTRPTLSLGNAEEWYNYNDGYQRGNVPKLGAVAVYRAGVAGDSSDGAGHVAIVEQINADGSIITSNSAWNSTMFYMTTCRAENNYEYSENRKFMGFIYPPVDFVAELDTVDKSEVISGNRYLSLSEMKTNARYIMQWLSARGWTLNAIAGMIGNFQKESTINPGIWEGLDEGDTAQGYGLVQWTPATKYLEWCSSEGLTPGDMDSALLRIEYELAHGLQYYPTDDYPETFSQFKTSTKSAYYLGMAFVTNYERPKTITTERGENADFWYDYLLPYYSGGSVTPEEPGGEWTPIKGSLPLWLLVTASRRR